MKPTLVIYGNCQAEAIAVILNRIPAIVERYRVVCILSFNEPNAIPDTIRDEDIASCALLCEQHSPQPFSLGDRLPEGCRRVSFPSTDFNLFWPFFAVNPFDAPDPPVFPFGHFPYGDRTIIGNVQEDLAPSEILHRYLTGPEPYQIDLDRLLQIEEARIENRDSHCDVRIGDYVLDNFRSQRLHWTSNHPTSLLLGGLLERLLNECAKHDRTFEHVDVYKTLATSFSPAGPLGIVSVPIHPKIAEHFELAWYDYNESHAYFDGRRLTYEQYFTEMIAYSVERKRKQEQSELA